MDRPKRNINNIEKQLTDMTISSDNTRVVLPYRAVSNNTSSTRKIDYQRLTDILQEERRKKEEQEAKAQAIRDERQRIRDREAAYKKRREEQQRQYEQEKKQIEAQSEENDRLKDKSYEDDYKYWLDDVTKNPDKYSQDTQNVVKRAMHSYKHPHDYLARLDRGIARLLFGIKNRAGSVALNSIDTNGTRYQGEISLRQHEADALKEHQNRLDKQSKIQDLQILQQNYQPGSQEYNDAQRSIDNLNIQLNDPLSIQLDEDYKQFYTINKSGTWDLLKKAYRNYISSEFTYDQYKDYVTKRNRQQDVNQYYNALVQSRNDAQKDTKGADFLYSKVNMGLVNRTPKPSNQRTLQSYSPEELFDLDVQKTRERSNEIKDELDAYQKLYKENREHYFDSMKYWEVSDYFKYGVEAHQNDPLWSWGYWGYSVYPMIGSTASSPEQAASTALNLASMGGFASSPWTGGVGSGVGAAAGVAAGYYGLKSGYAENTTEAGQRRIDRFKELLSQPQTKKLDKTVSELKDRSRQYWKYQGRDDKWINEYLDGEEGTNRAINDYFTGLTKRLVDENGEGYIKHQSGNYIYTNPIADKDVLNAELYSTQGLQALYDADNARTVVGNLFQTIVSLTPTGSLRKAASMQINKAANKVFARSAAKAEEEVAENVAKNTYKNGFRRKNAAKAIFDSAYRGAAIGEMTGFGVVGEVVGGAAGAGVGAAKLGLEALPTHLKNLYRSVEEGVLHKYQKVYDKLLPTSKLGKAVTIYGGRAAKTTLASSMSEAAEEAVQYLNSKEDYASKYGWNGMSLADALINDVYQGARVFNSYGALLGITNSELLNDSEYWANVKGGFALGGLHTGVMRVGIEGVNAYREIPTHEAIINSAIMNRELDKKDRAANVEFARQAMRKRTNETLSVLDWMEKNESRREQPFFTQEDYDEKRRAAVRIGQLANDKNLRGKLEAKGIVYGTEEYANAIADRYSLETQAIQNQRETKEKQVNINAFYNSKEYQQEADSIIEQELSNSFEETMGRQARIIKAGNEAVAEEIKRANAAGEDTKSSEFKRHLQNIRKDAQEQASRSINLEYRNNILEMSHAANKLKSLLKLKQQHKSISDFFKFLSSKFNLNPRRADAKLIYKNIEEQIKEIKRQFAEIDENFNENLSDEAIIEYIEGLPRVKSHEEEIEDNEIAAAMLQADAAVINQHLGMLDFGLMRDKSGKWTYNPSAYKQRNKWQKDLTKQLESGEITLEQYLALQKEPPQFASYNENDVKDNPYKKRIQAIIDARKDDQALEDMANDIEYGDGVVKILDELARQEDTSNNSEEVKQQALQESNTLDVEDVSQPTEPQQVQVTPEQKYEERKKASKSRYEKRKKNLRDLRRNLRNRANAAIVPIPTPLLDLANILIHKAELGTYKIAEFAEQISQVAKNRGFNAKSFISGIKSFYIDNLVSAVSINPELMENFSSVEEIQNFHFSDEIEIKQPVAVGTAQEMQDLINSDLQYVDKVLSTHYDTIVKRGDVVEVYPNREAIVNARFGEQHAIWKWVVDTLTAANTSDESFRNALNEVARGYEDFPIEEYVKYRQVSGIIQAIANRRSNTEGEESIQNGKRIRNAVVAILLGNEDEIDTTYFLGDYQAFRNQVLEFKEKLTSKDNGMGLTILDTTDLIYGTDPYGNKISSEADIIATNGDKIYVIDVRYSFDSIRQNWDVKYPKATFSIGEHVTRRLKQIEQIINSKFGIGVNGLYCFPVVYDPSNKLFYVEQSKDSFIIPVRPDTADVVASSLDELKQSVQSMVNEINKQIDEYNSFVYESILYTDKYQPVNNIENVVFDTEQEYTDYINQLHAKYDTIGDRIDEVRTFIQEHYNMYTEVWNESIAPAQTQNDISGQELLDALHDRCLQLDTLMDKIPSLKATTEAEKQDIKNIVDLIFDIQKVLDDVLQDKRLSSVDFTREEELIASALELMAENKENFGEISMFVRNWWVTNFAVEPGGNNRVSVKTQSDIFFGYLNKIQSWTSTLRDHVLSDLENNIPLQEWYSSVLNKYFSELLNNAEQFANSALTDAAQKVAIQRSVVQGRELIENFNALYDTRPEEDIDAPITSPADIINRMPTKWKDKYSWTTSVMPSLDQMRSPIYYYLSTSPSFLDSKFILSTDKNGKLQLYIEGISKDGSKRNITLTFENDLSKASSKDVDRWQYLNLARQRFIRKALAALKFVKEHPNYEIKFDKSTNKGEIRYNENGELNSVSKFLFATSGNEHNLYTVKLSSEDRIGILVVLNNKEAGKKIYNVKSGDYLLDDIGGFDRDYQKQQLHTQSGALVYFYDTGNGQYIGTPIQSTNIGQDAPKLVYLIEKYIAGERTDQYGFDILSLLRMRLYMADPDRKISAWNNVNNLIQIQDSTVIIGKDKYDIVSQKQELINRISNMQNVISNRALNQFMGTSQNSVLHRLSTLFDSGEYKKLQLTNGLVFDKEDFTHNGVGSTWLGYMLRNNMLGSSATSLGYKELRIDNIRVVLKGSEEQRTIKQEIKQAEKQKIVVKGDDFFDRLAKLSGATKIVDYKEIDANRGVEEQESFMNEVITYFDSVLGENGKVEFAPTDKKFLGSISRNERIAGICTAEMIKLSRYVPMSVAWHEAFHKIFELVIPAQERDSFYNAYKHSIYGILSRPTDRDIAEAFADMFMTYMQNKQAINKADSFFKKIKPWIKSFLFNIGMTFKIGRSKAKEMYALYNRINKGEYRNSIITEEQNERFRKLFGEGLYYTVTNTDSKVSANFSNLADIGDRDKLVRGLAYYILKSYEIDSTHPNVARVRITGGTSTMKSTLERLETMYDGAIAEYMKSIHPVFEEVFESVEKEFKTKDGKIIKRKYYPKFEAISRHVADYISSLFDTMRKPKIEEDDSDGTSENQNDNGEAIDYMASDTDHWDKAAYEFSKLSGLMDEVKVFFGTIPYSKYVDEVQPDGTVQRTTQIDYTRNKFGCPEFMPIEEVWGLVVNNCMEATTIEELDKMLEELASRKEVYAEVYKKYHNLIKDIYKRNEDGKIIVAQTNFDKEAQALQILGAIQSQKMKFLVALSSKQKNSQIEGKSIRIVESSMERDARSYPDQWTRYLVSGQIGVFQRERGEGLQVDAKGKRKKTVLLFRDGMGGKNGTDIFSRTAKFFEDVRQSLLSNNDSVEIDGIKYNTTVLDDASRLKDEIIHRLNTIGIMMERDALDYMLSELYGGVEFNALRRFVNNSPVSNDPKIAESESKSTLQGFINQINRYVSDNGVINQSLLEGQNAGYGQIGFVNKLANWQGRYKRTSSQNMAYALNGKKLYSISQNSTISHIIKNLNTFDDENETIKVLSGFGYNINRSSNGRAIGSIILKHIANKEALHIEGFTYIGFKTDNKGDQGSEYTEESTVEDYMAKLSMLQQGYLIFPALADKGTYMVMNGIPIPGIQFRTINTDSNGFEQEIFTVQNAPMLKAFGGKAYLIPNNSVLDQMIEYAKCELLGIQECMEDLGYEEIPGYEKQERTPLTEEQKILNYHTKNKDVEPNGTRFLSLTKIACHEFDKESKKWKVNVYNLNDPRMSSVDALKLANKKFFARRDGETVEQMIARQRETMALTLGIQTKHEVDTAINLGIVSRSSDIKDELLNIDTRDLDESQIEALTDHFMRTSNYRNTEIKWNKIEDSTERAKYAKMARSLAIAAILQDVTDRHIISSQEIQRCFSGHPALFKVKYGKTSIIDSAYDIQKRIGGMVSTGEDNITDLPGISKEYTCAECNDYEVGSSANILSRLPQMFGESNVRYILGNIYGDWKDIYNMSIDELKEAYPERSLDIDEWMEEGKSFAKSFDSGINVADGASYITADMCRDMLRMRGAYNNKVRKAFKILMSSSKYDWVKSAEAYKTIYEALNIVPTKYTAYGFRPHVSNGNQVSNVAVAYYNKFALFPIFPCMAHGKMHNIYQKMLDEKVDMLLMTSAVKVGSQGAVSFDGTNFTGPFNTYKQSYSYLRRQLNTDPEEKDENAIGTQMMKIGLANLVMDREYKDLEGNIVSGHKVFNDLMSSVNELARIGEEEMEDMFMDTNEERDAYGNITASVKSINYQKVSDYLKEQLTQRNANKTLIQAIQYDPITKKLVCPLAATTDAAWIESIFISTMNKHVVDITTPGKSFIQRSVFGIEGKTGEGLIQGDSEMAADINNGQKLQMINEENSMDCIISIDYFRDIVPEGLSFNQAKQWLIDQGIISGFRTNDEDMSQEWYNAEATIIGYRIPTQAQSSIHALRVVDVLPATKTTIILPEEFTKITGSDKHQCSNVKKFL